MNRMDLVLTAAAAAEEATTLGQRLTQAGPSIVLMAVLAVALVAAWNRNKK